MNEAKTFKEWHFHASTLDRISGRNRWKSIKYSDDYDFKTTEYLLEYLKSMRQQNLISGIVHTLRSILRKNICGVANPVLYEKSNGGTKILIEDFQEEILKCIHYIYDFKDESKLSINQKLEFF